MMRCRNEGEKKRWSSLTPPLFLLYVTFRKYITHYDTFGQRPQRRHVGDMLIMFGAPFSIFRWIPLLNHGIHTYRRRKKRLTTFSATTVRQSAVCGLVNSICHESPILRRLSHVKKGASETDETAWRRGQRCPRSCLHQSILFSLVKRW